MIVSGGAQLDFAPQALGELSPIAAATGYFYADQGIQLLNRFALYGQMYAGQPWVATLVDKVAASTARLGFNVWDSTGDGEKVLDSTSAYALFWKRPCPLMPRFALWRWTISTYEIYGEAFWLKIRNRDGQMMGVYPMHPSRTIVERDADTGRLTYRFSLGVASAGILTVDEADVVPFLRYNPDNLMRGLSRLEPLRTTLYNEDASRRATESWWKRGARPSLMISAPNALSDVAYKRLQRTVESVHGGADQMGGTLVLEEGAKPVAVQLTAEEMQYVQSRVMNREECCGVFDVPPPVVHILDNATFSNITEQMRSMYRDSMTPRLEDDESVIDHYVTPEFFPQGGVECRFALDDVLRGDFETRATAVGTLISNGVMKPSEARPLFDLNDAGTVADRLYANSALQELGAPAEQIRITAGNPANPVPTTAAENDDVDEAENAAAREDVDAQEQKPAKEAARARDQRRSTQRRGRLSKPEEETE